MKDLKLFIWDFDGTLVDSYPLLTGYMHKALADFGHKVTNEEILEQMLDNVGQAIRYFTEKFQLPELSAQYDVYYKAGEKDMAELFPNVREVLKRVNAMGAVNLIYTNRGDTIFPMLEHTGILEEFTEIVNTAHPAFQWKPAPDSILYLMEKYGGTTENTVMIGDRICDLAAGYGAGCKTCHLLTPAVPQYPACDWRIHNFADILQLLDGAV